MDRWTRWMDRWQSLFNGVVRAPHPDMAMAPHPDMAMAPHWVEFRPYKGHIRPGDAVAFRLYVKNHAQGEQSCRVRFRSMDEVTLDPVEKGLLLAEGDTTEVAVTHLKSRRHEVISNAGDNGRRESDTHASHRLGLLARWGVLGPRTTRDSGVDKGPISVLAVTKWCSDDPSEPEIEP